MNLNGKAALVTGGNRGIGFEVCRQLAQHGARVWLGARNEDHGSRSVAALRKQGLQVDAVTVDVSQKSSIRDALAQIGQIEILINNAALLDRGSLGSLPDDEVELMVRTNLVGPLLLSKHLLKGMLKRGWGRIVNVTSGMGAISRGLGSESVVYRVTKLALNGLTICLAQQTTGTGVLVNSVDPGWVRTEMGGSMARKTPEEGAQSIVSAVLLSDDGPTGQFFRDGRRVDW